jgi:hypothetical protein
MIQDKDFVFGCSDERVGFELYIGVLNKFLRVFVEIENKNLCAKMNGCSY